MASVIDTLDDQLVEWIQAQPVFFVASAPTDGGHVNLSPKGHDSLRVLGPRSVAYLDLTGSGAETIAHTRENGRLTIMFCSFDAKPNIVRIFGRGEAVLPGTEPFEELVGRFEPHDGTRSIIVLRSSEITSSCGYSVPLMELVGHRSTLDEWVDRKTPEELDAYRAKKNATSLDGLPALS